ncbi:MAG: hypothetical protein WDO17_10105 [Alphaproteobacteria bacterium]
MSKQLIKSKKRLPPEIMEILGKPPILSTEDENLYYATFARFAQDVSPKDLITWFLLEDLVCARLEIARCRRFQASIVKAGYQLSLDLKTKNHRSTTEYETIHSLAQWKEKKIAEIRAATPNDSETIKKNTEEIQAAFQNAVKATRDACEAAIKSWQVPAPGDEEFGCAWGSWIQGHQSVENLRAIAEKRFFTALRELERHLMGFAKNLRHEVEIIEGEVLEDIKTEIAPA